MTRLKVLNLDEARFDCVFPVCGGVCCANGRPPVEPAESARLAENLERIRPHLRPAAQRLLETREFLTNRRKSGKRMLAVVDGYCVFFNEGCVLHRLGAEEGDRWRYKPWHCVTFPLDRGADGAWFVRQWGEHGEIWDLFCLNPRESPRPASETLEGEIAFLEQLEKREAWRFQ